ncbi:MAG: hypothetical protein QNJ89_03920 [Acidimicrobiia bacterium]|nr:hypothetical protein [Acidimicrobiia bacterium]
MSIHLAPLPSDGPAETFFERHSSTDIDDALEAISILFEDLWALNRAFDMGNPSVDATIRVTLTLGILEKLTGERPPNERETV